MPLHYVPSYQLLKRSWAVTKGVYPSAKEVSHYKPSLARAAGARSPATAVATIVVLESLNHSLAIDPNAIGRVVQGVTGIGFLGAGVILRDPKDHITGLTTAATIWICAVLGIVCGLGYWSILAISFGLTAFALLFGQRVERLVERLFKRNQSGPTDNSV